MPSKSSEPGAGTRTGRGTRPTPSSSASCKTPSMAEGNSTVSSLTSTQQSNKTTSASRQPRKGSRARSITPASNATQRAQATTSSSSNVASPIPSAPHFTATQHRRKESTSRKTKHETHKTAEATRRDSNNSKSSKVPTTLSATALSLAHQDNLLPANSTESGTTLVVEDLAATSPPAIAHVTPGTSDGATRTRHPQEVEEKDNKEQTVLRRVSHSVTEMPLCHSRTGHTNSKRLSTHRTGHNDTSNVVKTTGTSGNSPPMTNYNINSIFALTSAAALAKELPRSNEVRRSSTSDNFSHMGHELTAVAPLDLRTNAFDLHLDLPNSNNTQQQGDESAMSDEGKAHMHNREPHAPMHTAAHNTVHVASPVEGRGEKKKEKKVKTVAGRGGAGQEKGKSAAASSVGRGTKSNAVQPVNTMNSRGNVSGSNNKTTGVSAAMTTPRRLQPQPLPLLHDVHGHITTTINNSSSSGNSQPSTTAATHSSSSTTTILTSTTGSHATRGLHLPNRPWPDPHLSPLHAGGSMTDMNTFSSRSKEDTTTTTTGVVDVIELAMHRQSPLLTPTQRRASSRQSLLKPLTPLATTPSPQHNNNTNTSSNVDSSTNSSASARMFGAARGRHPSQLSIHVPTYEYPAAASRRGSQERRLSSLQQQQPTCVLGDIAMEDYEHSSMDHAHGPALSHRTSLTSQKSKAQDNDNDEEGTRRRRSLMSHTPDRKACTMQGGTTMASTSASLANQDVTPVVQEAYVQGKRPSLLGTNHLTTTTTGSILKEEGVLRESDSEDDVRAMRQHAERILLHSAQQRAAAAAEAAAATQKNKSITRNDVQPAPHITLTGRGDDSDSDSSDTCSSTDDDEEDDDEEDDDDEEEGDDDDEEYEEEEDEDDEEDNDEDDEDDDEGSSRRRRHRHHHRKSRKHNGKLMDEDESHEGPRLRLMTKVSREGDCNVKVMYIYPSTRFKRYAKEVQYRFGYSKLNEFDIYCIDEAGDHVDIDLEEDFELLTKPFWQRLRAQYALDVKGEAMNALSSPQAKQAAGHNASIGKAANGVARRSTHDLTATATGALDSAMKANNSPSSVNAMEEDRSTSTVLRLYVRDSHLLRQSQPSPRELLGDAVAKQIGQAGMNTSSHGYQGDTNTALYSGHVALSATGESSNSNNNNNNVMNLNSPGTRMMNTVNSSSNGGSRRTIVPASPLPLPGCTEGALMGITEASMSSSHKQFLASNTTLASTGNHDRLDSTQTRFQLFAETQRAQTLYLPLRENAEVQWTKMNVIGKGSYGTVYEGITSDGKLLAVKVQEIPLDEDAAATKALQAEINLMRSLRHKNIVTYYGCQTKQNDNGTRQMEIFMELCHGGSLASLRRKFAKAKEPFSISLVRSYTKQVLEGLSYLHGCKVMHRDIKSDNVLISAMGDAKLADFGCSKRIGTTGLVAPNTNVSANAAQGLYATMVGSPLFIAPEVMQGDGGYSMAADVWAVGCLVLELLGREPWTVSGTNVFQVIFQISRAKTMPTGIPKQCPALLMDFFRRCFDLNASQRATAAELLQHEWITCPDASLEPVPAEVEEEKGSTSPASTGT